MKIEKSSPPTLGKPAPLNICFKGSKNTNGTLALFFLTGTVTLQYCTKDISEDWAGKFNFCGANEQMSKRFNEEPLKKQSMWLSCRNETNS
jgi:hypothetical protein